MRLEDFTIQGCRSSEAMELLPKKTFALDLNEIASKLESKGIHLEIKIPMLLIFNFQGFPISLYKRAKIVIKNTRNEEKVKEIAMKLFILLK